MSVFYLIDVSVLEKENALKLSFFDPTDSSWKEVVDRSYRPYFFIPYPISPEDLEVLKDLKFDMQIIEKKDFCQCSLFLCSIKYF